MNRSGATCLCGHTRDVHEHYRPGSDCAVCGHPGCVKFRARHWWRRPVAPDATSPHPSAAATDSTAHSPVSGD